MKSVPNKTSQSSNLQTSFFLPPTCPAEVQKGISNLDAKKAVPINDLPIKYLKLAGTTISKFLSDLFNTCILDGEYPDDLKIAQKGNNSRKLWSTINEILNKGKKQTNVINKVQNELGSSDTTAFDIANTLSKYFSSIGEKLANQIQKPILVAPQTSPASNLQTSFFFSPTCPEEVQKSNK